MSKWTQEQEQKAADYIEIAYPDGRGIRGMGIALVDLACQRNELLEALKRLVADCSDYEAWARPCLAYDKAKAAIAKAEGQ